MREGNACIRGDRSDRADTGNNLKGNSGAAKGQRFFGATTKQKRISAFEPNNDLSLFRPGNEQVIDLRLFSFTTTADFPYVDAFGVGRHTKQHVRIDQIVIDHYIGLAQKFHRFDCEQTRIPGPGTDEIDLSRLRQTR